MTFEHLVARLAEACLAPLPGAPAQAIMAPRLRGDWPEGLDATGPRTAAGLLLFYPIDTRPHLVLTVRSPHVRHGGQVSLPGGVVEPGESVEEAALREAREEIAFAATDARVLGRLTPLDIPVSGFRLHPVVAATGARPTLHASDDEVARILEVPVDHLLNPAHTGTSPMTRRGQMLEVPVFRVEDTLIWGATAMVLAECLTLLGWTGGPR